MAERAETGHVCILMGVFNGAVALPEQLASFAAQSHADWQLIASDDGSTDGSEAVLRAFAETQRPKGRSVTLVRGPGRGFAANFLSLIAAAPEEADWLALSDQDDVWLHDRLQRGIDALSPLSSGLPALYCSRTWITDSQLKNRRLSMDFRKPPSFGNALVQNIAAGNTILLNRAAIGLARAAASEARGIPDLPAHDWWLYQLVTGAGGRVIRDEVPTLYYRQHGVNQIGANDSWRARATRAGMVLNGTFAAWNSANLAALQASEARLTPESRARLAAFAALRGKTLPGRIWAFARCGLYRQTLAGQMALWLAVLLGWL